MPEQDTAYFSRSFALLKRDKGWIKPLLVLSAANLVPFVGTLGVQGYALEWARLTAWGVDSSPKQKDVRVGECIKAGWRGFVAGLGYAIIAGIISQGVVSFFGSNSITSLLTFVIGMIGSIAYMVAGLRAAIYQDFKAGYRFDRMWDMVSADFGGFCKLGVITLLMSVVVGVIVSILASLILIPSLIGWAFSFGSVGYSNSADMSMVLFSFLDALAAAAPWVAIVLFILSVGTTLTTLITYTATGLWMRNFNVPAWGASEDPLPVSANVAPAAQPMGYEQQPFPGQQPYQDQPYQQPMPQQGEMPYQQPYEQQAPAQPYEPQPYEQPVPAPAPAEQEQPSDPYAIPTPVEEPQEQAEPDREVLEVIDLTNSVIPQPESKLDAELEPEKLLHAVEIEPIQPEQTDEKAEPVQVVPITLEDDDAAEIPEVPKSASEEPAETDESATDSTTESEDEAETPADTPEAELDQQAELVVEYLAETETEFAPEPGAEDEPESDSESDTDTSEE